MTTTPPHVSRTLERLDALSAPASVAIAAFLGSLAVTFDVLTGSELSFSIFYVIPVSLIAWRLGRRPAIAAAILAAAAWYVADVITGHEYSQPLIPIWNSVVRLAFFVISSTLAVVLHDVVRERTDEATLDTLTGLLNRRGFVERADIEIARSRRWGHAVTLAYADLDGLKHVNDSDGHAAGDALLRDFGAAAQLNVRRIDVVGRLGGDEFAFLFPETSAADAPRIIERLQAMQTGDGVGARFSLGIVTFESAPADIETALRRADQAMYRAKASGGSAVSYEIV